jgi:hypothetical protein
MIVFMKEKPVILSAPKTGTTSLQAALEPHASIMFRDPPRVKHINLAKYQRQIRKLLENLSDGPFETFGIVRHPLDWMGSWYRYRQRDRLMGHQNSTHGISFDAFLSAYMSQDRPHFARVGDQARFFKPRPDDQPLDHLFQYKQLDQAVAFLENRLGRQIQLPQKNVSPKIDLPVSDENYDAFQSYAADQFTLWQSAHR